MTSELTPVELGGAGLEYLIVDVFTPEAGQPFAGNPLAVVLGADDLSTAQCHALTVEFNLSETVFPIAPTDPRAHYRARIFTPGTELPFAGHPSVGVAWTLHALGRLPAGEVVQECGAGLIALQIPESGGPVTLTGPLPTTSDPIDPAPLLAALHLTGADLGEHPARTGGSGIPFAYLNVRADALERVQPDFAAIKALTPPVTGVHVGALTGSTPGEPIGVQARMFAADIAEDPATGSASLGYAGWLVASGLAAADGLTAYSIRQGYEMGRPSVLACDVTVAGGEITRVRVTGHTTLVASGRIRLP
ncbi:MAG TPA: PhzF family phenazine biosynthesis protein [Frankiaceae bacterium]|nr:PhzF family phenazine biosynthesis protein [Frankiaceae bacterium]